MKERTEKTTPDLRPRVNSRESFSLNGKVYNWSAFLRQYELSVKGLGVPQAEREDRISKLREDFLLLRRAANMRSAGRKIDDISAFLGVPLATLSGWLAGTKQPRSFSSLSLPVSSGRRKPVSFLPSGHASLAYVLGAYLVRPSKLVGKGRKTVLHFTETDRAAAELFAKHLAQALAPGKTSKKPVGVSIMERNGENGIGKYFVVRVDSANLAKFFNLFTNFGARVPKALFRSLEPPNNSISRTSFLSSELARQNFLQGVLDRRARMDNPKRDNSLIILLKHDGARQLVSKLLNGFGVRHTINNPASGTTLRIPSREVPKLVEKAGYAKENAPKFLSKKSVAVEIPRGQKGE